MDTAQIVNRLSKTIYVVLLRDQKGNLTLLMDPGLSRPWSSKNKRLADFHAAQCDGEAHTWESAFSLLRKECPDFEKQLIERVVHGTKEQVTRNLPRVGKTQPFLDSNGNPIA